MAGLAKDADVDYLYLPKPPGILESFLESDPLLGSLSAREWAVLGRLPEIGDHARALEAMLQLRAEPVWVMLPHGLRMP
jgi:hypothetical protein